MAEEKNVKSETSEKPKKAEPSEKKDWNFGGIPIQAPEVIMKGGTSSSRYDAEMQKKAYDAEQRRAYQDKQEAAARNSSPGEMARMGSHKMISADSPRLVLKYLKRDKSVRQECISEITQVNGKNPGELDTMFSLVCPRCLERGLPQGEAQLFIRDSHRKFDLDPRGAGPVVVDSAWGRQVVLVCGKVTVRDKVRCSNYNCDWCVRITDSNVMEA